VISATDFWGEKIFNCPRLALRKEFERWTWQGGETFDQSGASQNGQDYRLYRPRLRDHVRLQCFEKASDLIKVTLKGNSRSGRNSTKKDQPKKESKPVAERAQINFHEVFDIKCYNYKERGYRAIDYWRVMKAVFHLLLESFHPRCLSSMLNKDKLMSASVANIKWNVVEHNVQDELYSTAGQSSYTITWWLTDVLLRIVNTGSPISFLEALIPQSWIGHAIDKT